MILNYIFSFVKGYHKFDNRKHVTLRKNYFWNNDPLYAMYSLGFNAGENYSALYR